MAMTQKESMTKDEIEDITGDEFLKQYSWPLFARLLEVTSGEANTLVRMTQADGRCGLKASRKITERSNPKTFMKLRQNLIEAVCPGKVKDLKELPNEFEKLEILHA